MGGKREVELETWKCLLYCLHSDFTIDSSPQQRDYFLTLIYYYCKGNFLNSESFKCFTCIAVSQIFNIQYTTILFLALAYYFHPILQCFLWHFPLQLPCLLQQSLTQMYMYTFGCFSFDSTSACITQHNHKSLSP